MSLLATVVVLATLVAGGAGVLWSILVGTLLPALTAFVTRENATPKVKALLTALISGVTGAVSGFLITPPSGWSQWEQVIGTIAVTWAMAAVSYFFGWKPTGAAAAIARATASFGVGGRPAPPAADHPPAAPPGG